METNKNDIVKAVDDIYQKLVSSYNTYYNESKTGLTFEKLFQKEVREISSFTFGGSYELIDATLLFNNGIEFNVESGCLSASQNGMMCYKQCPDEISFMVIDYLSSGYHLHIDYDNPYAIN